MFKKQRALVSERDSRQKNEERSMETPISNASGNLSNLSEEQKQVHSRTEEFQRLRKETIKSRQAVKVLTGAEAQKVGFCI